MLNYKDFEDGKLCGVDVVSYISKERSGEYNGKPFSNRYIHCVNAMADGSLYTAVVKVKTSVFNQCPKKEVGDIINFNYDKYGNVVSYT